MNKIVGLDIGKNSVKMAYFVGRELKRTAKLELPDAMVSGGRILSMDAMADFLHDAAKGSGIPLTNAALVVPASEVYTRVITLPAMTEQQLFYNLPYEFRDFLTEEKSKYFFDYAVRRIVNDETGHPKEMELFACAILKTTVEGYRAMLHRAGFRLNGCCGGRVVRQGGHRFGGFVLQNVALACAGVNDGEVPQVTRV